MLYPQLAKELKSKLLNESVDFALMVSLLFLSPKIRRLKKLNLKHIHHHPPLKSVYMVCLLILTIYNISKPPKIWKVFLWYMEFISIYRFLQKINWSNKYFPLSSHQTHNSYALWNYAVGFQCVHTRQMRVTRRVDTKMWKVNTLAAQSSHARTRQIRILLLTLQWSMLMDKL